MIIYLTKASKCDNYLPKSQNDFRKAALIISYISAVFTGLACISVLFALLITGIMPEMNVY
jgi:hypothetical protein